MALIAAIGLLLAAQVKAALISSPFDNFRIECPQGSGAQRLSIRMVESQGLKRQDAVYSLSCNNINELYPWSDIPQTLENLEHEDCHYSTQFDPIIDKAVNFTCGPREYLASVVRLFGTNIQLGCCKLRTRDEVNCENRRFGKPYGPDVKTEIELNAKLINAVAVEGNSLLVRFCDLNPRAASEILEEARSTTTRKPTQSTAEITTTKLITTRKIETTTEAAKATTVHKVDEQKQQVIKQVELKKEEEPVSEPAPHTENSSLPEGQPIDMLKTLLTPTDRQLKENTTFVHNSRPLRPIHGSQNLKLLDGGNDEAPSTTTKPKKNKAMKVPATTKQPTTAETTTQEITTESVTEEVTDLTTEKVTEKATEPSTEATTAEKEADATTKITDDHEVTETTEARTEAEVVTEVVKLSKMMFKKVETTSQQAEEGAETTEEPLKTFHQGHIVRQQTPEVVQATMKPVEEVGTSKPDEPETTEALQGQEEATGAPEPTEKEAKKIPAHEHDARDEIPKPQEFAALGVKTTKKIERPKSKQAQVVNDDMTEEEKKEADSLMKSLMGIMDAEKAMAEGKIPSEAQQRQAEQYLRERMDAMERKHFERLAKEKAEEVKEKEVEAATPQVAENKDINEQVQSENKNVDESSSPASFDFDAFPSPPPNSEPATIPQLPLRPQPPVHDHDAVAEKPKPTTTAPTTPKFVEEEVQEAEDATEPPTTTFKTRKPRVKVSTTESPYLVAEDPVYIEQERLRQDRYYGRRLPQERGRHSGRVHGGRSSNLYIDEETETSPFDFGDNPEAPAPLPSRFAPPRQRHRFTIASQEDEQPSRRFSLNKQDEQVGPRTPFDPEVRRSPVPRIDAELAGFMEISDKPYLHSGATKRRQRLHDNDYVRPLPVAVDHSSNSEHDGSVMFAPKNNKPLEMSKMLEVVEQQDAEEEVITATPKIFKKKVKKIRRPRPIPMRVVDNDVLVPMNEKTEKVEDEKAIVEGVKISAPQNNPIPSGHVEENTHIHEEVNKQETETVAEELKVLKHPNHENNEEKLANIEAVPTTLQADETTEASTTSDAPTTVEPTTAATEETTISEGPTTTTLYDPKFFYQTPKLKRRQEKEKYLTFCSKEMAIRDQDDMPVACGLDNEVWYPPRCPENTECFYTHDSFYRICCPVGRP
ncbi:unnamed protein product [Bursaphelenchus xylophilus]|uniref:(pine wood nematode) hypothetical protein n=1 Tax=Bursaphelenchus xylophilus TaxID=6326 RepID=A0A1I7SS52_BURXY|nr:unnamed protein product [Bursaphelenchus xylophilus]CAG9105658.1 unnamed protein product [Bursaphelenchus xylophilus]